MPSGKPGTKTKRIGQKPAKTLTDKKKDKFLGLLQEYWGVVGPTCEAAGISRQCYYDWRQDDVVFREKADDIIVNVQGDRVESQLLKNIKDGKETSTIFYAKTKLKSRGYSENQEIVHTLKGGSPVSLNIEFEKSKKDK